MGGHGLAPEEVAVIGDRPARSLERLVRLEALERALDAHEQLLVEVRDRPMQNVYGLVDGLGQEVEP